MKKTSSTILAFTLATSLSQAATIVWSGPTVIVDETSIHRYDSVVYATTFGNANPQETITVNSTDVVFQEIDAPGVTSPVDLVTTQGETLDPNAYQGGDGDGDWHSVLDSLAFSGAINDFQLTLDDLTVGVVYDVQIFSTGASFAAGLRGTTWSDDNTNGAGDIFIDANLGGYVLGTFTADATTQDIYGFAGGSQNIGYLNALVLTVPEPSSTAALLGLGGLALMLRRKRSAA